MVIIEDPFPDDKKPKRPSKAASSKKPTAQNEKRTSPGSKKVTRKKLAFLNAALEKFKAWRKRKLANPESPDIQTTEKPPETISLSSKTTMSSFMEDEI